MMYFLLGRANLCPMLLFKLLLAPLGAEWWRWSVLSSWTCVMLLFFFSYGVLSAALISHWSKLPLKFPGMKWNPVLWISISLSGLPSSSYSHILQGCAILLLQKDHSKTFIVWPFTLFYFYSGLSETSFCRKAEYWLQMRTDTQFDRRSSVDSEVKVGAGSM